MKLERMTKKQLCEEVTKLRRRVSELENEQPGQVHTDDGCEKTERWFQSLIENSVSVYAVVDAQGQTLYESPSLERVYGWKPEEIVGKSIFELVHPDDIEFATRSFGELIEKPGFVKTVDLRYRHKDGSWRTIEVSGVNLLDNAAVGGIVLASHDITERTRAEEALRESEERFRLMADNSHDYIFEESIEGNAIYCSPAIERILGYTHEERQGKHFSEIIAPYSLEKALASFEKVVRGEVVANLEVDLIRKDGRTITAEATLSPVVDKGEVISIFGIIRDITERKKAQEALRETKERMDMFLNSAPAVFGLLDSNMNLVEVNEAGLRLYGHGVTREDLLGRNVSELYPAAFQEGRFDKYAKILQTGEQVVLNDIVPPPPYENTRWAIRAFKAGKGIGVILSDITDLKKAEEELRESERRYRLLAENVTDVIWTMDMNLNYTYVSPSIENQRGYTAEELLKSNLQDTSPPETYETAMRVLKEEFELEKQENVPKDRLRTLVAEFKCKDGSTVWIEGKFSFLRDDEGKPNGILGVSREITDRKRTEEALKESEEKYRALVEETNDIAYTMNVQGELTFVGPQVRRYGLEPEDTLGAGFWEFIFPEDREQLGGDLERTLTTGEEFPTEFRLVDSEGQLHWLEEEGKVLRDESGNITGVTGMLRDITERKEAENALRKSEEKWRSLVENAPNIILMIDRKGLIQFINHTVPGLDAEQVLGTSHYDYIEEEYRDTAKKVLDEVFRTGRGGKYAIRGKGPDGATSWYETHVGPVISENEVVAVTLITSDITERIEAEEALRKSEERYRLLAENASDVIWTMDLNLHQTYVSPSIERLRGFTVDETMKQSIDDRMTRESAVIARALIAEELEKEKKGLHEPRTLELELKCKDDRFIWAEITVTFIRDKEGKPIGIVGVTREVTERKKAEEALRKSEEKFRNLAEEIADGVTVTVDAKNYWVNNAFYDIFGYTKEESIGKGADLVIVPEEMPRLLDNMKARLAGRDVPSQYETIARRKDGKRINISVTARRMTFENKDAILIVVRDITGQKQYARRLARAQEEERRRLSGQLHDDLGQLLTVAKIRVDRMRDAQFDDMVILTRELSEISALLDDALENTRDLSHRLRPPLLDQLGLVTSLKALGTQFRSNTGIAVHVEVEESYKRLAEETELLIYRTTQEALTNVAKHSQAGEVRVMLTSDDKHVELSVVDDGRGFDVEDVDRRTDCLGICSMRSRVRDSGGAFSIVSEPGTGTTVNVRLPLGPDEN